MSGWTSYSVGTVNASEACLIYRPKFPPTAAKRGIVYCHGNAGTAAEPLTAGGRDLIRGLVNAGHIVAATDLGGLSTWGNDTVISRITDLKNYLLGTLGTKPGGVVLAGQSMGGLAALDWAAANPTLVSCVVGLLPVVNLTDVHDNNRGGYQASIDAAYAGGYTEATYGATHNPTTMANAAKYAGMPLRIFYGDTDTIVLPSTVTAFATATGATATSLSGGHADATVAQLDVPTTVSFVEAHS